MRLRIQLLQKWMIFTEVMREKINVAKRGGKARSEDLRQKSFENGVIENVKLAFFFAILERVISCFGNNFSFRRDQAPETLLMQDEQDDVRVPKTRNGTLPHNLHKAEILNLFYSVFLRVKNIQFCDK